MLTICTRVLIVASLLTASLGSAFPSAGAASPPPPNDDIANATPLTLGSTEILDTTGMTVGPFEEALVGCDGRSTYGGVWFTFVGTGDTVVLDSSGSDYDTFGFVGVGPGDNGGFSDSPVCDDRSFDFETEPGTVYYILHSDDKPEDGIGGSLHLSFFLKPPPPQGTVSLSRFGWVDTKTGAATVHGTYECSTPEASFLYSAGNLTQRVDGRVIGEAPWFQERPSIYDAPVCDGKAHRWIGTPTDPYNAFPVRFRPGRAWTSFGTLLCVPWSCSETVLPRERVILRPIRYQLS